MNKRIAAVVLAVFACTLFAAAGQNVSPAGLQDLKARAASIVDSFPAESSAARDALCAELI
ncbi:MAG: hypothetical protein ACXWIA_12575, partial [Candidatus Aminicenantales bacterium]